MRVARSRKLLGKDYVPAAVARVSRKRAPRVMREHGLVSSVRRACVPKLTG